MSYPADRDDLLLTFPIFHSRVATLYDRVGQIYNFLVRNFLRIPDTRNHYKNSSGDEIANASNNNIVHVEASAYAH